jgi:hypothetical protein
MMKRLIKYLLVFTLSLLLFYCSSEHAPDNLIPASQMVEIISQLHIYESEISARSLSPDSSKLYFYEYQNQLMQKYQTDTATFNTSFRYYLSKGDPFDKIYSQVVDSLSLKEAQH